MAWSFTGPRASGTNKAASATVVGADITAQVDPGAILIVAVAFDNTLSADGDSTLVTITDAAGNVYTRVVEWQNSNGAAADGAAIGLYVTQVTASIAIGDLYTATFATVPTAKVIGAGEAAVAAGKTWQLVGSATSAVTNSTTPSATLSGLASQEYLFIGAVAVEGPSTDTFTVATNYTSINTPNTTGGADDTNIKLRWARRILTGTGDTFAPVLGTARDGACAFIALKEVDPPITSADVGSGVDAGAQIRVGGVTDAGFGSQTLETATVFFASADTGNGSEGVPRTGPTSADSGAGADAVTKISPRAGDVGSGTDAAAPPTGPVINVNSSDIGGAGVGGAGADAYLDAYFDAYTVAAGSETQSIALAAVETGAGVDAALVAARPASTDTGSGLEGTPSRRLANTDVGSDVEAATIGVPIPSVDVGAGVEGTPNIKLTNVDTGSGVDTGSTGTAASSSDAGLGLETTARRDLTDVATGAGSESPNLGSTASVRVTPATDTGAGSDASVSVLLAVVEAGSGSDTASAAAQVTSTETGAGTDTQSTSSTSIASTDTTAGVDAVTRITLTGVADTGAGVDAAAIALVSTDTGSTIDLAQLLALVGANDTGFSVEASAVGDLQTVYPDGDILTTGWTDHLGGSTDLWMELDEIGVNDADYITAELV